MYQGGKKYSLLGKLGVLYFLVTVLRFDLLPYYLRFNICALRQIISWLSVNFGEIFLFKNNIYFKNLQKITRRGNLSILKS